MFLSSTHNRPLLLALALLLKSGACPAVDVNSAAAMVLTFIEVRVEARGHAGGVLRQQANATRDRRNTPPEQVIVMQEISRPERFAALEREASATSSPHTLTADLTEDLLAPPDRRLNYEFDRADAATGMRFDRRASLYVVTHVDIAAADRSPVEPALRRLAAAARHSEGNLGFEILQQADRPNHFNLISAWLSESLFRAFVASDQTRAFRKTVAPVLGSPYDERLFRRVD